MLGAITGEVSPDVAIPKMDTGGSTVEPSWLRIEEASPMTEKQSKKASSVVDARRWSAVTNGVLVALIMTVPPILFILTGGLGAPAVWIKSTMAGLGAQRGKLQFVPKRFNSF